MADFTDALISIEEMVTRFLFKYRRSTDDAAIYTEHACACFRDFNLYDGNLPVTAKVTVDSTLKCIELPEDFLVFVDLVTPSRGQWWSFTEKDRIVNTSTTVDSVETRDSAQGEGQQIDQSRVTTYGAKGGYNKFKYTLDLPARRIWVDEDITEYVVLIYLSSGIRATGETTAPAFILPMIDAYLLWKSSYWLPELVRERESLKADYWTEKMRIRNLISTMSIMQWRDLIYSTTTQSPQR